MVNRPLTFKGLKGQYIVAAAAGLLGDFLLFILLYLCHFPPYGCLLIVFSLGTGIVAIAYRLNKKYGIHGWMKARAHRRLPKWIRYQTRDLFIKSIDSLWQAKEK
jgi:hypothetical protein